MVFLEGNIRFKSIFKFMNSSLILNNNNNIIQQVYREINETGWFSIPSLYNLSLIFTLFLIPKV